MLTLDCEHQDSQYFIACPFLQEDGTLLIRNLCRNCSQIHEKAITELAFGPLTDRKCIDCKKTPSRYNRNLMLAICDDCRLRKNGDSRPPPNVLDFPDEIIDNRVYLGSQLSASNETVINTLKISAILCCGVGLRMEFADDPSIRYYQLPIADSLDQEILPFVPHAVEFIEMALAEGRNVLIHCHVGISRSASITIAYVMKALPMTYFAAHVHVKARRDCINPNRKFANDLERVWQPIALAKEQPN